jgi:hypothetical protein
VHLDGARINTIDAIWTKDKQSISDDDHLKFFQVPSFFIHFETETLLRVAPVHRRHQRRACRAPALHRRRPHRHPRAAVRASHPSFSVLL